MRRTSRFCLCLVLLAGFATPIFGQSTLGVFAVEDLGVLDPEHLDVDIDLEGTTLQIAAGAMEDQDPRLMELVSNLTRVRVQAGDVEGLDHQVVADRVSAAAAELLRTGWRQLIRVEDADEKIYIFSVDGPDGRIAGLTALVSEGGKEAVVANLAGSIDPVLLGSVMARLGEVDFDQLISMGSGED